MKKTIFLLSFLALAITINAQQLEVSFFAEGNYTIPSLPVTETTDIIPLYLRIPYQDAGYIDAYILRNRRVKYVREVKSRFGAGFGFNIDIKLSKNKPLYLATGVRFQYVKYRYTEYLTIDVPSDLSLYDYSTFQTLDENITDNKYPIIDIADTDDYFEVNYREITPVTSQLIRMQLPIGLEWRTSKWNFGLGFYCAIPIYSKEAYFYNAYRLTGFPGSFSYNKVRLEELDFSGVSFSSMHVGLQTSVAYEINSKIALTVDFSRSLSNIYVEPIDLENTPNESFYLLDHLPKTRIGKLTIFSFGVAYLL